MVKISKHPDYKHAKKIATQWNSVLSKHRKEHGLGIGDVVAMSPGNDPFWMTPGKVLKAMWAEDIAETIIKPHLATLRQHGSRIYSIHLRDVHYILTDVGMNKLTWNDSETYQNTDAHWSDLLTAFANARYLGLVDPNIISDNKNTFNSRSNGYGSEAFLDRIKYGKKSLTSKNVLDLFVKWFSGLKDWKEFQPYHIEIWAEKEISLLDSVASTYDINTVIGEGETSVTQVYQIVERMIDTGKPVRIGYIADCDVVGSNMSKAMARKLEFVLMRLADEDIDVKLVHLMLTAEQVRKYNLPTTPMKTKTNAKTQAYETRKDNWMEARGLPGAVELNAFHARFPTEFKHILEDFVLSYFDDELRDKIKEFNDEQLEIVREFVSDDEEINTLLKEFLEKLNAGIDAIDWDEKGEEYDEVFESIREIHGEFDATDADIQYPWLFDSDLDYFDQLERYAEYENGELDDIGDEDD